jgi:hypothetical protein
MHRAPKEIAQDVRSDWKPIHPEAERFLVAMDRLDKIGACHSAEADVKVLAQFRWAARKWTGPVAGQIKSEIDLILKAY